MRKDKRKIRLGFKERHPKQWGEFIHLRRMKLSRIKLGKAI
jgi:hypothetical protein